MDLKVKLESFEGPLDLLLHLLEKNKVSIYDIPIVEITNQYMEYIHEMQRQDLNIMSEFLVMAATLLDIKCRMLLPKEQPDEEEETDPRAELVEQLLQYKMYKYISFELKDRQIDASRLMFRHPDIPEEVQMYEQPINLDEMTEGLDLRVLNRIFQAVMRRQTDRMDPIRSKFGKIEKEEITLDEKMEYLEKYSVSHHLFGFRDLLERQKSRIEVIVTFLAVLEMMKIGSIKIHQDCLFGEILIESQIASEKELTEVVTDSGTEEL